MNRLKDQLDTDRASWTCEHGDTLDADDGVLVMTSFPRPHWSKGPRGPYKKRCSRAELERLSRLIESFAGRKFTYTDLCEHRGAIGVRADAVQAGYAFLKSAGELCEAYPRMTRASGSDVCLGAMSCYYRLFGETIGPEEKQA